MTSLTPAWSVLICTAPASTSIVSLLLPTVNLNEPEVAVPTRTTVLTANVSNPVYVTVIL